jgi:hypothetical protein
MTEQDIINKYFKKPNLLGNREYLYNQYYRINRKGWLQRYYLGSWDRITWADFNARIAYDLENNNINKFDWGISKIDQLKTKVNRVVKI